MNNEIPITVINVFLSRKRFPEKKRSKQRVYANEHNVAVIGNPETEDDFLHKVIEVIKFKCPGWSLEGYATSKIQTPRSVRVAYSHLIPAHPPAEPQ
jgi:hypothetical protein